jgi:hypothetical protein
LKKIKGWQKKQLNCKRILKRFKFEFMQNNYKDTSGRSRQIGVTSIVRDNNKPTPYGKIAQFFSFTIPYDDKIKKR